MVCAGGSNEEVQALREQLESMSSELAQTEEKRQKLHALAQVRRG